MPKYGYNYPWSGRLGRIAKRCLYCGTKGPHFQFSSCGDRCLDHENCPYYKGQPPIPELLKEREQDYDKLARAWCKRHYIDYDATVKNYLDHLGPQLQERDDPIPGADKDYTVYIKNEKPAKKRE